MVYNKRYDLFGKLMKKIILFAVGSSILGGAFFFYKNKASDSVESNRIVIPIDRSIKTLDPALAFDDDSLTVLGQALDTLFQYHYLKRPHELIPALAEAMPKISNKGKTYTIHLKDGIRYHDHPAFNGKPRYVKAEDFKIAIKRLAFKPLGSVGRWLFEGKLVGFDDFTKKAGADYQQMLRADLEGVKIIDELTIQLDLIRPEPNLIYFLAMNFTSPVPRELVEFTKNDLSDVLVGNGSYKLVKRTEDEFQFQKFKYFRNEKYPSTGDRYANTQKLLVSSTQRLPFIDNVIIKAIPDESQRWEKFLTGEIDIISVPMNFLPKILGQDPEFYKMMKENDINVKHFSKLATRWVGFNMQSPVWGKGSKALLLRKAVAHAIDFDAYNKVLSNNTNLKANSIFNPSISGYNPSHFNSFEYNLVKAKRFLKEAGYPEGKGLDPIQFVTRGNSDYNLDEANFLKSQLEKVGFKVEIKVVGFGNFLKLGRSGKLTDFWVDNWIYDYPDAENVLQLLISKNSPGINKSQFESKKVDQLYEELANTLEPRKRYEIMYAIEDIVYEQLPWIMLTYESSYILHHNNIKNFRKSYFIKNYVKYLKKK